MANAHTLWPYVGKFSYHLYGSIDFVPMANFAKGLGLPTAQTEFLSATVVDLLDDLTVADVVHWEKYSLWGRGLTPGQNVFLNTSDTTFIHSAVFWKFRQFFDYVRPGARRIGASAADPNLRSVAFERNGAVTVVVYANPSVASTTVTVRGLPAGLYGVSRSVGSSAFTESAAQSVSPGSALTITVPADSVTTVYARTLGENRRPIVTSAGMPSPFYLTLPASQTSLSASAVDPEGAALSWTWATVLAPSGRSPVLATPSAATTQVTGMTVAGRYDFRVSVSDGVNTSQRTISVAVHSGNQAPRLTEISNRNPKYVALPATSTTLAVFSRDVESPGSALSTSWSLISSPPGATVTFAAPTSGTTLISGMSVAGDYVVEATITDPQGASIRPRHTIKVYPPDVIPMVSPIAAAPAMVMQPASTTTVSATTSNGNVGPLTHWWTVVSAPLGSNPRFVSRASPSTQVTGLTAVGTYQFELIAISRERFFSRPVTVQVVGTAPNTLPVVSAGPDQTVTLPRLAVLAGAVADDGKPAPIALTQQWIRVVGPGPVTFNFPSAPITNAIFTTPGVHTLRLTASDGAMSSADDVVVTVLDSGTAGGGTAGGGTAGGGTGGGVTAGGGTAGGGTAGGGTAGGGTAGGGTTGGGTAGGGAAGAGTAGGGTAGGGTAGGATVAGGTAGGNEMAGGKPTAGGSPKDDGCPGCSSGRPDQTLFLFAAAFIVLRSWRRRERAA
jgi:hypothetical protein